MNSIKSTFWISNFVFCFSLLTFVFQSANAKEINIYSYRSPALLTPFTSEYEKEFSIKFNILHAKKGLAQRLKSEGKNSPADLILTEDISRLSELSDMDLVRKIHSSIIDKNVIIGSNSKILVSNGKSLVIKTRVSYYRYPLKKTPLNYILDKKYLINKIYNLEEKIIDESFINYSITENNNEINIFFDNKTFNLIGWQTKDIYQNINVTYFSSIQVNQKINKSLFKLPSQN